MRIFDIYETDNNFLTSNNKQSSIEGYIFSLITIFFSIIIWCFINIEHFGIRSTPYYTEENVYSLSDAIEFYTDNSKEKESDYNISYFSFNLIVEFNETAIVSGSKESISSENYLPEGIIYANIFNSNNEFEKQSLNEIGNYSNYELSMNNHSYVEQEKKDSNNIIYKTRIENNVIKVRDRTLPITSYDYLTRLNNMVNNGSTTNQLLLNYNYLNIIYSNDNFMYKLSYLMKQKNLQNTLFSNFEFNSNYISHSNAKIHNTNNNMLLQKSIDLFLLLNKNNDVPYNKITYDFSLTPVFLKYDNCFLFNCYKDKWTYLIEIKDTEYETQSDNETTTDEEVSLNFHFHYNPNVFLTKQILIQYRVKLHSMIIDLILIFYIFKCLVFKFVMNNILKLNLFLTFINSFFNFMNNNGDNKKNTRGVFNPMNTMTIMKDDKKGNLKDLLEKNTMKVQIHKANNFNSNSNNNHNNNNNNYNSNNINNLSNNNLSHINANIINNKIVDNSENKGILMDNNNKLLDNMNQLNHHNTDNIGAYNMNNSNYNNNHNNYNNTYNNNVLNINQIPNTPSQEINGRNMNNRFNNSSSINNYNNNSNINNNYNKVSQNFVYEVSPMKNPNTIYNQTLINQQIINSKNNTPFKLRASKSKVGRIQRRDKKLMISQEKNRYLNSFLPHRNLIEILTNREASRISLSWSRKLLFSLCFCVYRNFKQKAFTDLSINYIDKKENTNSVINKKKQVTNCCSLSNIFKPINYLLSRIKSLIYNTETLIVYKVGTELSNDVSLPSLVYLKNSIVNLKSVLFNNNQNLLISLMEGMYTKETDISKIKQSDYLINSESEFLVKCNRAYNTVISSINDSEFNKNIIILIISLKIKCSHYHYSQVTLFIYYLVLFISINIMI